MHWKVHKKSCRRPKNRGIHLPLSRNKVQLNRLVGRWYFSVNQCKIRERLHLARQKRAQRGEKQFGANGDEFILISMRHAICTVDDKNGESRVDEFAFYPVTADVLTDSFDKWLAGAENVRDKDSREIAVYDAIGCWRTAAEECPKDKTPVIVAQDHRNWGQSFFLCFV